MSKSSRILAAQKFLSTAENNTRFRGDAFSTFVQLTKQVCLEYGAGQGLAVRENCGNVGRTLRCDPQLGRSDAKRMIYAAEGFWIPQDCFQNESSQRREP